MGEVKLPAEICEIVITTSVSYIDPLFACHENCHGMHLLSQIGTYEVCTRHVCMHTTPKL